jgi:archaellum component FlaG (FlaF/FlaG flagellin family)
MKKILTLFITLAAVFTMSKAYAQSSAGDDRKIKFDKTTHEFGEVEHAAPTETVFTFTNTSDNPVVLKNVRASCGCTTPNWTREAVAPGASGEIKVKYNSHRTGRFTKAVTVTYDSVEPPIVLYIKGTVKAKAPTDADVYKVKSGSLSFDRTDVNVGAFDSDQEQTVEFLVKNTGPKVINFTGKYDAKDMVKDVKSSLYELEPGTKGTVKVTLDGSYFDKTETFTTEVKVMTDDEIEPEKTLRVSARVNRVFSAEELAKMPNIQFEKTTFKGGEVIEGEKLNATFAFTNTGGSDLIIESVKASCGCTATEPKDKVIKPGQSSEIIAKFDSRGRPGKQVKSISVRTKDPDSGTIQLRLECQVVRDPFHQAGGAAPMAKPRR